ncbi:hypothetical protein SODALDRAFT_325708 [Sodiomyces alkalinus F11]|uniref:Uncharacterized protein n=1 Tax=Sodiomyces alkalinus (strain CBS 110278 / VKM F-3762 / F11) TaxID=1314773 RepID=A0A3N2PPB7_SODAK|nr:hypothetical protein SODALDRAFT_325708 [Sodiomyces alkalinus F11]ROT36358.1 hypothetical protein SODALDRAFT_325708 [Sodiomyces alkalinus F11]
MAIDPQTRIARPPPKPAASAKETATSATEAESTNEQQQQQQQLQQQEPPPQPPPSPSQRFFRPASADPPRPPSSWQRKAAVLEAEIRSKNCNKMGCQLLCYRMRPAACFEVDQAQTAILFPDGQLRRDPDPRARVPPPALRFNLPLFCIECGVRTRFYAPGDQIRTRSHEELWMCGCGHLRRKTDRYESRLCGECGDTCLSAAVSSRRKRRRVTPPEDL